MNYFDAVQKGRTRAKQAQEILQELTGPSYPMLFLKMGREEWEPVGEELLYSVVLGKEKTAALVICDSEGNSKAISSWLTNAEEAAALLEAKGIRRFDGQVKLPI